MSLDTSMLPQSMLSRANAMSRRDMTRLGLAVCALSAWLSPLACNTSGFKDTYMALDADGNRKRGVFYTESGAIYCVAELVSAIDDVTVVAKLRVRALYDPVTGQPQERAGDIIGAEEQAPGMGTNITASFLVLKPEGAEFYPAGQFTCELYLNGVLESSLDYEVRYPDCPLQPIESGSACAGLVLLGSECPSPAGGICTCATDTGLWSCG